MIPEHPITPPPELVQQWSAEIYEQTADDEKRDLHIATRAARWGADQELEMCCEWLRRDLDAYELVGLRAVYLDHNLRSARRPRPPSLKEQALAELDATERLHLANYSTIRRALEQLDD